MLVKVIVLGIALLAIAGIIRAAVYFISRADIDSKVNELENLEMQNDLVKENAHLTKKLKEKRNGIAQFKKQ